jgi:YVTN family beta-propeller protein
VAPGVIAITPDGKTEYVLSQNVNADTVTPISTATNTARKAIKVGPYPHAIAITPDGATAYVACFNVNVPPGQQGQGEVTPIHLATGTAGKPVSLGTNFPAFIAITPDGKTAYVVNYYSGTVTPIRTATNTTETPISVSRAPDAIAITP